MANFGFSGHPNKMAAHKINRWNWQRQIYEWVRQSQCPGRQKGKSSHWQCIQDVCKEASAKIGFIHPISQDQVNGKRLWVQEAWTDRNLHVKIPDSELRIMAREILQRYHGKWKKIQKKIKNSIFIWVMGSTDPWDSSCSRWCLNDFFRHWDSYDWLVALGSKIICLLIVIHAPLRRWEWKCCRSVWCDRM